MLLRTSLAVTAAFLVALVILALAKGEPIPQHPAPLPQAVEAHADRLADAADAFLTTLDDERRERATWAFDDEERYNWHFIPREREGLPLKDMEPAQRRAAHDLMKALLSTQGYLKATHIMALEAILRVMENNAARRDPENYYFSIFGEPDPGGVWGLRIEGHHLSLNFSAVTGALSVTPSFWGSNPAEVRVGTAIGLRVLGAEEDMGRTLVMALSDEQRERAIIDETAPDDVITGADREASLERFEGLPVSDMTNAQRGMAMAILEEAAHNLHHDVAHAHLARIRQTGIGNFHFAWAGPTERGAPHYYRLHGPETLIEYDNTQNDANHVHFVWRDLTDDFGADLLRRHYDESGPDHGH